MKAKLLPASVSLCMIVRDEANQLKNCLDSVRDLVDEIIIVDTGSRDKTPEIARAYTEKVIAWEWSGDFAAARNQALQHATGAWILQVDASDTLEIEAEIFQPLDPNQAGYFLHTYVELAGGGYQQLDRLLLFQNRPEVRYPGIIGESPLESLTAWAAAQKPSPGLAQAAGLRVIQHAAADTTPRLKRRAELLLTAMELEPADPDHLYNYCLTQRGLSQVDKCISYLNRLPRHADWFRDKKNTSVMGILGFLGLAVLLNQVSAELVDFFKRTGGDLGARVGWSDVRLTVPYALWLKREGQPGKAAEILQDCIRSGIAPMDVPVSLNERISPIVLLMSLFQELDQPAKLYGFIGELPQLLTSSGLNLETVFEVVYGRDPDLFEYIFELLKSQRVKN